MSTNKKLIINSEESIIDALPEVRLIDVIREKLKLTGTKEGCGEGECGACTIILNGKTVNSCLVLFGQLTDGDKITTIEGLSNGDKPSVLQQSFIDEGAIQCGMCIPGMVLSAHALLAENPNPAEEEIRTALSGNLCRCTGYTKIVKAVMKAANAMKHEV